MVRVHARLRLLHTLHTILPRRDRSVSSPLTCFSSYFIDFAAARRQHDHITFLYLFYVIVFIGLIIPFVVILILGHGANIIHPDTEEIIFVVFDIVLSSLLPTLLIIAYEKRDHIDHGPTIPEHWFEHRNAEGVVRLQVGNSFATWCAETESF